MHSKNCRDWTALIARILIGLLFVMGAYGKFTGMEGTIGYISSVSWLPAPAVLAWLAAIVELLGGLMLILGIHPNGAAVVLAVYLLPVSFIFHLKLSDMAQMTQLFKNLAIIGGLLMIHVGGSGKFKLLKCKCCPDCGCGGGKYCK